MQAIIRCGNGKYYCSPIFGIYYDEKSSRRRFDSYVICFDESKQKLERHYIYDPEKAPCLDLMVLITDVDRSDWVSNDERYEGISFLPWETALKIVDEGIIPAEIQKRCSEQDFHEDYSEFKAIETDDDIEKLMLITGDFHDARIAELEERPDGSLYVLLDGIWGCSVEILFFGDVSYCTDSRDPKKWDPYWSCASIIQDGGYIYFVDDFVELDKLNDDYCWFKALKMEYRILPK